MEDISDSTSKGGSPDFEGDVAPPPPPVFREMGSAFVTNNGERNNNKKRTIASDEFDGLMSQSK
jgi:hypothetical protein